MSKTLPWVRVSPVRIKVHVGFLSCFSREGEVMISNKLKVPLLPHQIGATPYREVNQ